MGVWGKTAVRGASRDSDPSFATTPRRGPRGAGFPHRPLSMNNPCTTPNQSRKMKPRHRPTQEKK